MVLSLFSVALKDCSEMFRKFIGKHRVIVNLSIKNFFCKSYLLNKLLLEIFTVWIANNVQRQPPEVLRKKVFLEILQSSQENACDRVSFLIITTLVITTLLKKRLWHRCFPVNFVKFLRTPFYIEHLFSRWKVERKALTFWPAWCFMCHEL